MSSYALQKGRGRGWREGENVPGESDEHKKKAVRRGTG